MIQLENVCKEYSAGMPAVRNINLHIKEGEFVFIVGNSGVGKTTLFRLLLKEIEPTSGKIVIAGQELSKIKRRKLPDFRKNIGVVFQDFRLLKEYNVYENIAFAQRVVQMPARTIKREVPRALSMVGLADKYKSFPDQLSGGEQQRVAIARALINKPQILIADEPTGNLDPQNSWDIMQLLEEVNANNGTTIIVVTHNREIVDRMKKRVIHMDHGEIINDVDEGGYFHEA